MALLTKQTWKDDQVTQEVLEAYSFIFTLPPTDMIQLSSTDYTDEELIAELTNNDKARSYLKKQFTGLESFEKGWKTFPFFEIDKLYRYVLFKKDPVEGEFNHERFLRFPGQEKTNVFDLLYEVETQSNTNSLAKRYLHALYNANKPLFEIYINSYTQSLGYGFDYTQYEKISPSEGQELADAALKYLTWGLEYGKPSGKYKFSEDDYTNLMKGTVLYPSQTLTANDEVKNWLYGETTGLKELNYLPENLLKPITSGHKNPHMLERQGKIPENYKYFERISDLNYNGLKLSTPFFQGDNIITGYPLPYVKGGIDSPRTFNYKMYRQKEAIDGYIAVYPKSEMYSNYKSLHNTNSTNTTKANKKNQAYSSSDYYFTLGNPTINSNDDPFIPGNGKGLNSAGVDSTGMLTGALAMTSFGADILDIKNYSKANKLDDYYSMREGKPALRRKSINTGSQANPNWTVIQDPLLSVPYRYTREDIEKMTVVIPDLREIQPGDLLIKGDKNDNMHVGIVIHNGNDSDLLFNLNEVLVLTVQKDAGAVTLGYWGNNGVLARGFSTNPKDYVVRRLIKYKDKDSNKNHNEYNIAKAPDTWDAFFRGSGDYTAVIEASKRDNYDRWIPNTGELYTLSRIAFGVKTEESSEILTESNIDVKILPPEDMYAEKGLNVPDNIKNNKGDGFAFYALKKEGSIDTAVKLATFTLNDSAAALLNRY